MRYNLIQSTKDITREWYKVEILKGTFAFEGIVIGRVFLDKKELSSNGITALLDEREIETEIERFRDGLELSKESLERLKTSLAGKNRRKGSGNNNSASYDS